MTFFISMVLGLRLFLIFVLYCWHGTRKVIYIIIHANIQWDSKPPSSRSYWQYTCSNIKQLTFSANYTLPEFLSNDKGVTLKTISCNSQSVDYQHCSYLLATSRPLMLKVELQEAKPTKGKIHVFILESTLRKSTLQHCSIHVP